MMKEIKNKSASIKAKLLDISKIRGIDFDALLLRYLQERFLHRLMLSEFSDKFVLKGGLLLICFKMPLSRPTKDVDLPPAARGALFEKTAPLDPPQKLLFNTLLHSYFFLTRDRGFMGLSLRRTS
jgi:hypothetical protein